MKLEPDIKTFLVGIVDDPRFDRYVESKKFEFYQRWKREFALEARETLLMQLKGFETFINDLKSVKTGQSMGDRK